MLTFLACSCAHDEKLTESQYLYIPVLPDSKTSYAIDVKARSVERLDTYSFDTISGPIDVCSTSEIKCLTIPAMNARISIPIDVSIVDWTVKETQFTVSNVLADGWLVTARSNDGYLTVYEYDFCRGVQTIVVWNSEPAGFVTGIFAADGIGLFSSKDACDTRASEALD
ncbi:hypothetical protein HK107_06570 [Parvularcula sp. ZS-1/3]|uniref:Uncharacterized protein n=1 Tax=Parvularcula mediterranea TaxID=2732508 RepID=A0A7Y3W567_9PROT|nr:hypothetical protein [Parvularcula mediterranea]NNU15982.1 hypothetical protein [Parvularcula mediterranea]